MFSSNESLLAEKSQKREGVRFVNGGANIGGCLHVHSITCSSSHVYCVITLVTSKLLVLCVGEVTRWLGYLGVWRRDGWK